MVEYMDRIAAGLDAEMATALQKVLEKQGTRATRPVSSVVSSVA